MTWVIKAGSEEGTKTHIYDKKGNEINNVAWCIRYLKLFKLLDSTIVTFRPDWKVKLFD